MLDMLADTNHLLSRAKLLKSAFDIQLNRVAEGELKLTDRELEELQSLSKAHTRALEALGGVVKVVQPVEALIAAHRDGQLPEKMREAYELLYCRSYGTGALYLGDVNAEKVESANSSWAVKGGAKAPHRSGATRGKSPTAHKRNIVQDAAAYDFKRRVDKKLSRIATEIRQWLAGEQSMFADARRLTCPKCGRIADISWKVCPIDGHRLKEEE